MTEVTIYHNPACGTSRNTLALIRNSGIEPRIVEYLKTPPSEAELDQILKKLGVEPERLARKKEPVYAEKAEGHPLTRTEWLQLFHEQPRLIERPIVVIGNRAIVARPPEKVLEIL